MKSCIEDLSNSIKETVRSIEQYKVGIKRPGCEDEFYDLAFKTEDFINIISETLYDKLYLTTNLIEDHIRSVYIFMDDATLEGHATELENHLTQLRIVGENMSSATGDYNDEMGGIIRNYLSAGKMIKQMEGDGKSALENSRRLMLFNSGYYKTVNTIQVYKENCLKLLSVLAITLGRWENKLEDRVDTENFNQGMVMSKMEETKSLSMKKGKRRQKEKDNLYL